MMIATRLKEETKKEHQSLEKVIIERIKNTRRAEDYCRMLQMFYGFYQPAEQLMDAYLNEELVPWYAERRKAAYIKRDLFNTGNNAQQVICTALPGITDTATALGAFYVLEGSTLGGVIISRMLKKQAGIADTQLAFFNGYGTKGMEMWQSFIQAVNNYETQHGGGDTIILSAKNTFKKFEDWNNAFYGLNAHALPRSSSC